jgi:hypothetical protein
MSDIAKKVNGKLEDIKDKAVGTFDDTREKAENYTNDTESDPTKEYESKEPMSPAKISEHELTAVRRENTETSQQPTRWKMLWKD